MFLHPIATIFGCLSKKVEKMPKKRRMSKSRKANLAMMLNVFKACHPTQMLLRYGVP